jgi:transposase
MIKTDVEEPELPPATLVRWTPRRKAAVAAAVLGKLLGFEEACQRYDLSEGELRAWLKHWREEGVGGLKVTRAVRRPERIIARKRRRHDRTEP